MRGFVFAVLLGLLISPVSLSAQEDDQRANELSERQRRAETKMNELEAKFEIIAQKLEEQEPERAARLKEALNQAKDKLIKRNMAKVAELLNEKKYDEAEEALDSVILNLEELVRLLLNDKDDKLDRQEEIEQLKKWQQQIVKIKKEQQKQTRETDKIANKDKTLKDLQEQIATVQDLIKKQTNVIAETAANSGRGLQALDRVADKQFQLRKQTESLAKKIAGPDAEKDAVGEAEASKDKSGQSKSGQSKSGQSKSGQSKSGQSKSGQSKSGQSKSGQS
ncbi:MAG: hypothetical protein P8J91_10010, partial [Pirellulaceae bacterium]|nr:hypothetical protein [Pirellulaceae bacterium]